MLFFFKRCADHRDLPPPPTGRASDLADPLGGGVAALGAAVGGAGLHSGRWHPPTLTAGGDGSWVGRLSRARRDRKSTRLNSSHANISYAVFFLKKIKLFIPPIAQPHE